MQTECQGASTTFPVQMPALLFATEAEYVPFSHAMRQIGTAMVFHIALHMAPCTPRLHARALALDLRSFAAALSEEPQDLSPNLVGTLPCLARAFCGPWPSACWGCL